jgi:hypothetical protein
MKKNGVARYVDFFARSLRARKKRHIVTGPQST